MTLVQRLVAEFIGTMNFVPGIVSAIAAGLAEVSAGALGKLKAKVGTTALGTGSEVAVAVRPEKLRLHWQRPGSDTNVLAGHERRVVGRPRSP